MKDESFFTVHRAKKSGVIARGERWVAVWHAESPEEILKILCSLWLPLVKTRKYEGYKLLPMELGITPYGAPTYSLWKRASPELR